MYGLDFIYTKFWVVHWPRSEAEVGFRMVCPKYLGLNIISILVVCKFFKINNYATGIWRNFIFTVVMFYF
jgi:hypothetical protein